MTGWRVTHIDEPDLSFGFGQRAQHPKDGLFLYGPPKSNRNPARMDVGVIGTESGIALFASWVRSIRGKIEAPEAGRPENKMMWPGFQSVFGIDWPEVPFTTCQIDGSELDERIRSSNRSEAIYNAVGLYEDALRRHLVNEEARPHMWFVIVPDIVFKYGRPKSRVPKQDQIPSRIVSRREANRMLSGGWLFAEDLKDTEVYLYEENFHNQLKARILDSQQVLQVVRESTLVGGDLGETKRRMQDRAAVAWNLSTTSFYKAGGTPWRIADVREGVCYVGLVFKKVDLPGRKDNACCGAQMFLASGEGIVFKGAVGPWFSEADNSFHLRRPKAEELMKLIVTAYEDMHGKPPSELFIHGKTWFNEEEWDGFSAAVPHGTRLVGIRIRRQNEIKLFRLGKNPVLRGTAIMLNERSAYLWTTGFVPRLNTYAGREVPNPLTVDIVRGDVELETVLVDLMSLTKLNFNSASFADGLPVTLRFADLVGEILTAAPLEKTPPLPFKAYI
ncbi:argonaute/piwi family protein [Rhizobium leguminosarum]|uniref:argonaute/piwi family protein n=1 Tax=Rhizobium leguminosarum TaxID=384 RepID=UPI003D071975